MAATPRKAAKARQVGKGAVKGAKASRAGATKLRDTVKTKATRRAEAVKAKIKAQVAGLDTTREARTTRVKAAVDAVKAKRSSRTTAKGAARAKGAGSKGARMSASGISASIAKVKTARMSARAAPTTNNTTHNKPPVTVVKPKRARTRIEAGVKAKIVKGRRVAIALTIADAHAAAGTTTPKPRRHASDAGGAPANENASTTLSAAPLATIAPRGVFLPDRVVVDVEGDTFPRTKLDEHGRDEAILSGSMFETLKQQVAEGQRLVDRDTPTAFRTFRAALELLPAPVQNWNAAGWLLVAMGECAIRMGDFAAAFAPLKDAMHCPGTIGNPWVHLLLGRCRLELGDERAADELARAYMGGGRALFDELDPKYFALVEHVLKPPPGHDRLP